ncbi:unnamed protein product [Mytilus coruscus]|uniref:Myb-like domain-containing protein n=1 Tax=Mytilus coruscus TaxID=42192 RepID=A0A6J8D9L6_MYTCO|nr:unnamed protein product [Mytilus coruscus]
MTSFTSDSRKKQVRFHPKDDLVLLREVLAKNPFQNKSAWNEIALSVADTRSNLQVRETTHLLIDQHKKSNADSLKRLLLFNGKGRGDDDFNDATPSKRNSSGNIVGYLKEKNDAEMIYKRQELEVRKQQLQLEEEKFKLVKKKGFRNWKMTNKKKHLCLSC